MDAEGSNGSAGDGAARTESTRAGRKHDRISHRSSYQHPSRRRVRPRRPAMARTRCAQSCVADAWLPFKKCSRRAPNSRPRSSREPPNVRTAIHPPLPMHVPHYPSFTEPESDVTATHATRHDALSDLSARVEKKKSGKDRRRPTQHISEKSTVFSFFLSYFRHQTHKGALHADVGEKNLRISCESANELSAVGGQPPQRIFGFVVVFPPHWLAVRF